MGKDSHFTGQPVYSQVLKLLDKDKIRQISHDTQGSESYVKRFGGYDDRRNIVRRATQHGGMGNATWCEIPLVPYGGVKKRRELVSHRKNRKPHSLENAASKSYSESEGRIT